MKKRLTVIILSICMALSLSVSASASSIDVPSMGGGNIQAMTDEIYTDYYLVLHYLYSSGQWERMDSYVMRLYDDYGLNASIISDAFEISYTLIEDIVYRYTVDRDNNTSYDPYEDWKHTPDSELPTDGEGEFDGEGLDPDAPADGSTAGGNTTGGSTTGNPAEDEEADDTRPVGRPNSNTPPVYNPNLNQPANPLTDPLNPDLTSAPVITDAAVVAAMEALARNELMRNIVYAKISDNQAELETYYAMLEEMELTFEELVTLSDTGVTGLETLLRSYRKDLSFLDDLLSPEFLAKYSTIPIKARPTPTNATAIPTPSKVLINDEVVAFESYNIHDNNFFKLRDLAFALTASEKQFEVTWDAQASVIALISGLPYTVAGGELGAKGTDNKTALPTTARIFIDGEEASFTAYNIDGNNYFKLRDIGEYFDFGIGWDADTNTITVDTSTVYVQ